MQEQFSLPRSGIFSRLILGMLVLTTIVLGGMGEAALGFTVAYAAGSEAQFGLQPVYYNPSNPLTKSYFIFDSKPGIVVKSSVRVTNSGTARGSVNLYPVDATTGQTSGAVYLNQNDLRNDIGAWTILSIQQLTLNPGQSQIVPFQVAIPNTVRPGQHLGGIVAENLTQQNNSSTPNANKNNSTFHINIKNLTIIAIQVNLPGTPIEHLAGTGIQAGGENGYQRLLVGLNNTGTEMLKPYGTLQVTDAQGSVENFTLKLDTFLPQTAINYPVAITGVALASGDYQARLDLTYGHGQTLHYTTKFTITQQQITQTFGSNKTQAPVGPGGDVFGLMPLWQLVLVAGGGLAILWMAGSMIFKRLALSRVKTKPTDNRSSQFKRPTF